MFGIGFPELFIILLVALLAFGPEKLPEIARMLGKVSGELKKGSDSLRKEFYNSVYTPAEDWRDRINQEGRSLVSTATADAPENAAAPASDVAGLKQGVDHTSDGRLLPKVEPSSSPADTQAATPPIGRETDRG